MTQLHNDANIYKKIVYPDKSMSDHDIEQRLAAIASLDATVSYPFIIRAFRAYEQSKLSRADLLRCLLLIESFLVRRAVCDVPRQGLNKLFVQWCKGYAVKDTASWLAHEMASGETSSRRFPDDNEFAKAVRSKPLYEKKLFPRLMLVRIEESYEHRERPDLRSATIEHVLPQVSSPAWSAALGPRASVLHAELVDTLANLTLSAYNSEMGNKAFGEKKAILRQSNIVMNRWICEQETWDAATIGKRADLLVSKALELWPSRV